MLSAVGAAKLHAVHDRSDGRDSVFSAEYTHGRKEIKYTMKIMMAQQAALNPHQAQIHLPSSDASSARRQILAVMMVSLFSDKLN